MNLDGYECEGQMNIEEWLQQLDNPEIPSTDEIPSKAWHYTASEQPEQDDVYYCITVYKDTWIYKYMAWRADRWWFYDSYMKKYFSCNDKVLAWVYIPKVMQDKDPCLPERRNALLTQERWRA